VAQTPEELIDFINGAAQTTQLRDTQNYNKQLQFSQYLSTDYLRAKPLNPNSGEG
jgi:hypothetical protein